MIDPTYLRPTFSGPPSLAKALKQEPQLPTDSTRVLTKEATPTALGFLLFCLGCSTGLILLLFTQVMILHPQIRHTTEASSTWWRSTQGWLGDDHTVRVFLMVHSIGRRKGLEIDEFWSAAPAAHDDWQNFTSYHDNSTKISRNHPADPSYGLCTAGATTASVMATPTNMLYCKVGSSSADCTHRTLFRIRQHSPTECHRGSSTRGGSGGRPPHSNGHRCGISLRGGYRCRRIRCRGRHHRRPRRERL